jgi:hypothetical protein
VSVLVVPPLDEEPWPTLGPQVCDLLETYSIFGPGSLKGQPYRLDAEKRAAIYRAYEVYPRGHVWAGRRRFKRVGYSVRKGLAKTELLAQITYAELHREGPVRCDGFDASGNPVGRPVADPYIPLLAVTVEQVEELAYGALYVLCTEGPDADLFDATLDRIIRLGYNGAADGKAVPLSNSPGSRDGARTTFQGFDEPHRLYLPRAIAAHETMVANLEKRSMEDPWGFYVGTAGELGQGSIAEGLHAEAEQIARGEIDDPQLAYIHRDAGQVHDGSGKSGHDLSTIEGRIDAIREATGSIGEYSPGQFHSIARQWDRPTADKSYLERVWLNRWVKSNAQAFDPKRWGELAVPDPIKPGAFVTAGFDGARFRDSTGIVLTEVETGKQQLWATWERPIDGEGRDVADWEVPEAEVTAAWEEIIRTFNLWKCFGDPPHWTETFGSWAGRWPDKFEEWWTNRLRPMAFAVKQYREAMDTRAVPHVVRDGNDGDAAFDRHIAAAGRKDVEIYDDTDKEKTRRLFVLQKIHPDRKFDNAMAGCLSWQARLEAIKTGARAPQPLQVPVRLR